MSDHLSVQVSELLRLISDHPLDEEIREVIKEIKTKWREAKEKKELLGLVSVILELTEKLKFAKEEVRAGRVVVAAEALRELKTALRIRDYGAAAAEEEESEPVVYHLLRRECMECLEEIQEVLVRFMENAVRFDQQSNAIRVKYQSAVNGTDWVELRTILKAMDVIGILDYGLAKVADLMIKYVITPAVNYGSHVLVSEEINQDSDHITDAILKIVPSSNHKVENVDGETIYSASIQVVKFIYNSLCFQNDQWTRCFGRLTWPRMSELIISNFLSKVVPDEPSKLSEFQLIIQRIAQFETELKEMMFISASENKDERLSNFANNVEVHFALRKKVVILAKARNMLQESYFVLPKNFTTKAVDSKNEQTAEKLQRHVIDLLFSSERCVVSGGASKLMELVHQTLKDVCLSSTRVALEFYHAARDALLLYEAVIPVKYRSAFPNSIKELSVFIDLAPRFQLMAEEILRRQIQLVIYNLKEAINGADGFQNTHQMKQFKSAKFSIHQVVFILEKVHIFYESLLLPSTYKRSMCTVLEALFSRTIKDLLLLDDLAADETLQLQRLIHLMLENLSSLMESLIVATDREKPIKGLEQTFDDIIPSLRKICKLAGRHGLFV